MKTEATVADAGEILVPLDFSRESAIALRCGASIAQRTGAQLTVLHVLKPPICVSDFPYPGPFGLDSIEAVEERIAKFCEGKVPHGMPVKTVVRQGFAVEGILATIRETHARLVVMGPHIKHGLWHFLTGGVAKNVERRAPCPAYLIPGV
jgi:nucleotide-binding universal stress UspA family protein